MQKSWIFFLVLLAHSISKQMNYPESYYKSGNYKHYLESGERYKRTAREIAELLERLNLIEKTSSILDYGCGVGFLMEGFHKAGYHSVLGYDISEWAMQQAKFRGSVIERPHNLKTFGWEAVIALDVFEHMEDSLISKVLAEINTHTSPVLICRIPVSEDGKDFHLEVSRNDKTHINCKKKEEWITLFKTCGYTTFLRLNLISIYDAKGVLCLLCLKPQ